MKTVQECREIIARAGQSTPEGTMRKIEISDSDLNIIKICLEIGRDRFTDYTATLAHARAIDQFDRQAKDAARLLDLIGGADRVIVHAEET